MSSHEVGAAVYQHGPRRKFAEQFSAQIPNAKFFQKL